ncbi:hypothetical protein V866_005728 [Kwoniella sp. B9012]
MGKTTHAPDRKHVQTIMNAGMQVHPDTMSLVYDDRALAESFGGSGLKDLYASKMVLLASLSACIGGLLFGFDQGILSICLTMPQFLAQFPETDPDANSSASLNKGVMTALLELGAFLGALSAGWVADKWSRKMSIVVGSVWFVIGTILQASSYSFAQLVVGRFVGGIGVGILSSTAPMYISEIAPPNIRGAMLVLEQGAIVFGAVAMYYITYGSRHIPGDWSFRLPFTVQMAPCVVLVSVLFTLPYSPRWLALRGRDDDCLVSLCRLRGLPPTDPRIQAEWITIRAEAIRNREVQVAAHPSLQGDSTADEAKLEIAGWFDMFKKQTIRQTLIGIILMFFQQFSGINALVYYSPTLFQQLGLDYELQLTLSGVLNIAQLVAVIVAFFVLDRVGRRFILLAGSTGLVISHSIVAAMIGKYAYDWPGHKTQAWVGVAFIFCVMLSYGVSWGPVPWAMPAEIHVSSRRAKGVALTTASNWINNFIIGLITPPLITATDGYGAFAFFAAFSFASGLWTFFFVPETKGRTLEQMDTIFKSHTAIEDAEAKEQILQLLCGEVQNPTMTRGNAYKGRIEMIERVEPPKSTELV